MLASISGFYMRAGKKYTWDCSGARAGTWKLQIFVLRSLDTPHPCLSGFGGPAGRPSPAGHCCCSKNAKKSQLFARCEVVCAKAA